MDKSLQILILRFSIVDLSYKKFSIEDCTLYRLEMI